MPKLDLVGTSEIRERHGLARHRVFRLRRRGLWPEPLAQLHCGAIWDGREVKEAVRKLQRRGQL